MQPEEFYRRRIVDVVLPLLLTAAWAICTPAKSGARPCSFSAYFKKGIFIKPDVQSDRINTDEEIIASRDARMAAEPSNQLPRNRH